MPVRSSTCTRTENRSLNISTVIHTCEGAYSMNAKVPSRQQIWVIVCVILSIALAGAGCSQGTSAANPAPAAVEVAEVQQKDVPIYGEWIGTLDGLVNADIKAQVSGYLLKQNYIEGSFIRKGQSLFDIDPRPFQASLDQSQ